MTTVRVARFGDLDALTLHALLRLRVDVFVVEQACPYPELDGRDTEPGTVHIWTADDLGPTAYLRLLDDGALLDGGGPPLAHSGALRIGRVCTRFDARGRGLAAELMRSALAIATDATVVLAAQSHLAGWYARFGFVVDGSEFVEDGIAHQPMRRGGKTHV